MTTNLPRMVDCNGCGDCCGPASARPKEIKRIRRFLRDAGEAWIPNPAKPLDCGFLRRADGLTECAIYSVRPWVCRAFGVVKEMPCAHFPEAVSITLAADEAIRRGFMGADDRLLGEAFEKGYAERLTSLITIQTMPAGSRGR